LAGTLPGGQAVVVVGSPSQLGGVGPGEGMLRAGPDPPDPPDPDFAGFGVGLGTAGSWLWPTALPGFCFAGCAGTQLGDPAPAPFPGHA